MKIKILFAVLICIFLCSCASAPREKEWVTGTHPGDGTSTPIGEQTVTFDGLTYDRVYDACEQTLIRLGYSFHIADKSAGKIRVERIEKIRVEGTENPERYSQARVGGALEGNQLLVELTKADGGVAVKTCVLRSRLIRSTPLEANEAKSEVDRFFKRLKKALN